MKRILFISQSKLAQQLMALVVAAVPRKIDFYSAKSVAEISEEFSNKPVQLIVIDHTNSTKGTLQDLLPKPFAKTSQKILLVDKDNIPTPTERQTLQIDSCLVKPLLADELANVINKRLGEGKS